MKYVFFVFINFIVSLFSDIILNDLANNKLYKSKSSIILSLKDYFENKSIIISGIYAGLTVIICLIITSLISKLILNFYFPNNLKELIYFNILSFLTGYIADILIDKLNIFGSSLHKYYKIAGAGFWGAIAFIFSINTSYFINYILCELFKQKLIC